MSPATVADLPPAFSAHRAPLAGAPGVRVRGEVDIETVPVLSGTLDEAIRETTGALIVDLSEVVFLDSTGVAALVRARAMLGRDGREIALVCPPGPARRILEVAGVADLFPLFESPDLISLSWRRRTLPP